MSRLVVFIVLAAIFQYGVADDCEDKTQSEEAKLHKQLLCKYDRENRPVKNHNDPVNITLKMLLKGVAYSHQFDAVESITITAWMLMKWKDEFLNWKPEDHGGLNEILMDSLSIWSPDISTYNTLRNPNAFYIAPCQVEYDGTVTCIPQITLNAACDMNYKNWPRDQQNCSIVVGTWMHTGEQVSFYLASVPIVTRSYQENKYWKLIALSATRTNAKQANSTFPTVRYNFVLERHTTVLAVRLWTPILAMLTMSIVALCLNIEAFERSLLMFFNVACHFVFLNSSEYYMPSSGEVMPRLLIYYRNVTVLACALLFESVLLKNMVQYTTSTPVWIIRVTELMKTRAGRIVFHEFDPTINTNKADDVENLTPETVAVSPNTEWKKFVMFVNRLFTIVIVLSYALFIIMYLI